MADMIISSVARSWRLIKASIAVLNADGELIVLPALSGIATAIVAAAFVWQAMDSNMLQAAAEGGSFAGLQSYYLWLFAFYLVEYFIIIFFNTALVGAAIERLDGGDPTIRSALALALRRIVPIFGYAVVSATVGLVLRFVSERFGIIGRLIGGAVGLAWTVATFLVVPVLAAEGVGPVEAIEKSAQLLRRTWGENIIGAGGISVVMSLFAIPPALVFAGATMLWDQQQETLALVLFVASGAVFLAIVLLGAALSAVYAASVYHYTVAGSAPKGFEDDLIREAFTRKNGN